jgi:hypothetical protein
MLLAEMDFMGAGRIQAGNVLPRICTAFEQRFYVRNAVLF